ncbi:hypothetical protein SARC_10374 [Sphaeroforma arctica JP610]|uniref:Sushi domain-containing protein n=1 Tax=Sphaeroforma arctica JP610 TaxID=667725 RepID=A0A0L0FK59_9EUKA|nr:hypothetical protein SARC_10374 [Sphaeroforma arctica JP610]KNC77157.1 hypothetical protein SARC_10374 [Sphaeroforma arctica JP610]|eukprot:XP_014151059.1 hypothetical protein SARC_10374 [Sphaeroforma arctica JP610]
MYFFSKLFIATCALSQVVCANPSPRQAEISADVFDSDIVSAMETGVAVSDDGLISAMETGTAESIFGSMEQADEVTCLADQTCPVGYSKRPSLVATQPPNMELGQPLPSDGVMSAMDPRPIDADIPLPVTPDVGAIICHQGDIFCPTNGMVLSGVTVCCPPGFELGEIDSLEVTCECVPSSNTPRRQASVAITPAIKNAPCVCMRDMGMSDIVLSDAETGTMEESMFDDVSMTDNQPQEMESDVILSDVILDAGPIQCLVDGICDDSVFFAGHRRCCPDGFEMDFVSITASGTDCQCIPL